MTPPVRVLHPITRLIVGGAQENTLYTAERLDPARFDVTVVCGPQAGPEGSLLQEARDRGIALCVLPDLVRQVSPLRDLRALMALRRMLRTGGFTIVHTHSSKAGVLGRVAALLAGTPIVVHTVHGWSFHDHMPPLTRWTYILLERACARFTHALVAVAEGDVAKGLAAGIGVPGQYRVIRSAIPLAEFEPDRADRVKVRAALGIPAGAPVIGNVGRFSTQKDPLAWIAVAARVAARNPDVRFLLVGDGPLRPQVEAALDAAGIRERTVLTGLRRDVPDLLAAMDIFLLTSQWEGLPRVLPQAMAMRLPVVATRADGSAEAVEDGVTGYLCAPGDTDALADRCLRLLQDPQRRDEMGAHGRERALSGFDLQGMLTAITDLYEQRLEALGERAG